MDVSVVSKRRLTFNGLHSIMSQKLVLVLTILFYRQKPHKYFHPPLDSIISHSPSNYFARVLRVSRHPVWRKDFVIVLSLYVSLLIVLWFILLYIDLSYILWISWTKINTILLYYTRNLLHASKACFLITKYFG
jgi:hypothetical protein